LEKTTFVTNLTLLRKRKILLIRVALSLLWLTLVAMMWLSKAQVTDGFRNGFKTGAILLFGAVVYVCVAALGRMSRRLGLHCPHCQRSLTGPNSQRAVDNGTCFHCGMNLF